MQIAVTHGIIHAVKHVPMKFFFRVRWIFCLIQFIYAVSSFGFAGGLRSKQKIFPEVPPSEVHKIGETSFYIDIETDTETERLRNFEIGFIPISKGLLPGGLDVGEFESSQYPVTRGIWAWVMGEMPIHVPFEQRPTWSNCPMCPVTYVNLHNEDESPAEIQQFLDRLNTKFTRLGSKCIYDLPTNRELWYLTRGDQTGKNTDRYSLGVTDSNVDDFINHWGNSDKSIRPIGNKTLNAFGIEIGNVWKISKDQLRHNRFQLSHPIRGGSWKNTENYANSNLRSILLAGFRTDNVGFSLVRSCGASSEMILSSPATNSSIAPVFPEEKTYIFSTLGPMVRVENVIWSGLAEHMMNYDHAFSFCQDLGEGSRLPTREESEKLGHSITAHGEGHEIADQLFWILSLPIEFPNLAFYFNGGSGSLHSTDRLNALNTRCVVKIN